MESIISSEQLRIVVSLAIAMFLGALIGLDREAADKPAGLRTHILVAGASALLISLGQVTVAKLTNVVGEQIVRTDPIRIIEAVIVGISFLGAGTIIRDRSKGHIKGLTTAASLLVAAVASMNVAHSQWIVAVATTIIVLIVLRLLPWVERKIRPGSSENELKMALEE